MASRVSATQGATPDTHSSFWKWCMGNLNRVIYSVDSNRHSIEIPTASVLSYNWSELSNSKITNTDVETVQLSILTTGIKKGSKTITFTPSGSSILLENNFSVTHTNTASEYEYHIATQEITVAKSTCTYIGKWTIEPWGNNISYWASGLLVSSFTDSDGITYTA